LSLQEWISSVQQTLRLISVLIAISMTQSPSMGDNLYQGERRAIKWQSTYGCCVETLPMVIGHISHFAIY